MRDPKAIISTDELARILGEPDVRVYDCTTYNNPPPPGLDEPYLPAPGLDTFRESHIPGADFLDLQGEFSDRSQRYWFMMPKDIGPPRGRLLASRHWRGHPRRALQRRHHDVGHPLLVDAACPSASTTSPCSTAASTNGRPRSRPVESGDPKGYSAATFKANPRPGMFVDKLATKAAIANPDTVIVNALGPQFHAGLEPSRYGRPGRIPGSVNVSAATLVDPDTKGFTTLADAAAKLEAKGVTKDKQVICYCGGGISATIDLFLMHQLGYDNLTLYDASMGEWARDESLPIETD